MLYTPHDYQESGIKDICTNLSSGLNGLWTAPTGSGKCFGRGTKLMLHSGKAVAVEDVRVGDVLMGPDSQPRVVSSLAHGSDELFDIVERSTGESYRVNSEHVLSIKLSPEFRGQGHRVVNLPVREYLGRNTTFKHRAKGYRVSVDFPDRELTIDPYYMGLWLADGTTHSTNQVTKPDAEILKYIQDYAATFGLVVNERDGQTWTISKGFKGGSNPLMDLMREYGVQDNKHVPPDFLYNSRENRLELLAGLLDGDGHLSHGCYEYSSTLENLADSVVFIARSLGLRATKASRWTTCQTGARCFSYRVNISGHVGYIPCRIPRKQAEPRKQKKDATVYGFDVVPVGVGEYFGFELEGPDRLFLLADFSVSHNSTIHAGVMEQLPKALCVVPTIEIAIGIHKALGCGDLTEHTEAAQRAATEASRIFTSMRARKALEKGMPAPEFLLFDEGHHDDDTHETIWDLCGRRPKAGLTATPYRGTPSGTAKLSASFDHRITPILTEAEAVARGVVVMPEFSTLPLLDDEMVDVSGGEFVVKSVESELRSRFEQLIAYVALQYTGSEWAMPSTVVMPSGALCVELAARLNSMGCPAEVVLAGTKGRQPIFKRCIAKQSILIQMRVVGEGVDLPLRWMLDISPTMSPVLWMQRVGRIRRPGGKSFYISACHNLLRHGYLFEDLMPPIAMSQARKVWGKDWKPSRRMMSRALNMTGLGKFKPAELPLRNGDVAWMYAIKVGLDSYAALLVPGQLKPKYFHRADVLTGATASFQKNGHTISYPEKKRGIWHKLESLPEIVGAASYPNDDSSPGMYNWWQGKAGYYGLDPEYIPTSKEALILPIICDCGDRRLLL